MRSFYLSLLNGHKFYSSNESTKKLRMARKNANIDLFVIRDLLVYRRKHSNN